MKNIFKILVCSIFAIFISCEKGEIFTGTPVGTNVVFESIVGTIVTNETTVVDGQKIPITVTLPKSFDEDVNIQATTFIPSTNKRSITSFILPAGQTTVITEVASPPNDNSTLSYTVEAQVFLTALGTSPLKPTVGFDGTQYELSSNVLKLDFGADTVLPGIASSRLSIRLDYESPKIDGATLYNDLNLVLKKTDGTIVQPISNATLALGFSGTNSTALAETRYDDVNISSVAPIDTYTISIFARKLTNTPTNLKYRFVVRFPDKSAKTYTGLLNDLVVTNSSLAVAKLKIVKTSTNEYLVTQI